MITKINAIMDTWKKKILLKLFLVIPLVVVTPGAAASWVGLNYYNFGQNQSVIAELGSISSVTGCPAGGINDFIYPWADFYIIQGHTSPGSGAELSDVSNGAGIPNTLQYLVIDEVLGNTAPAGYLISGNYSVVADDCQDGKFNGGDWWGEQFTVSIPADIEPLSDTGSAFAAQLAATKSNADQMRDYWIAAAAAHRALFDVYSAQTLISIATSPADFILFACTNINLDTGTVYCSLNDAWNGMRKLFEDVVNTIINQAFYYKGIAADPPDNNFTEIPILSGGFVLDLSVQDSNLEAALRLGELTSQEAALAEALLHAMERYQGAELAGNGEYAFVQARQIEDYARALADAIPRTVSGYQALATQVESSGIDFVSTMNDYRASQTRVNSSGLTAEERLKLLAAGWTEQNINDAVTDYLNWDFSGLQTATELSTLAAQMAANQADAVVALNDFADVMLVAQTDLAVQLRLPFPDADAGGPYNINEGASFLLDASASSHPDLANSQLTFSWDLDLDGEFDDATGETPTVTLFSQQDGLIGLRVRAPTGYYDVAYARVTVNNVNSPPQISAAVPASDVVIPFDGTNTFEVTANDPDGDTISYTWDLDGNPVGSGVDSYMYNAILADAGEHIVTVTISDGSNLSPDTRHFWRLTVTAPDVDVDGYPSNIDCDDGNAAVNPGATEVYYNGLDDDCDAATPDDPDLDNDGYDYTVDCDEGNADINPGASEICNLIDDNCDGLIDEGYDVDGDLVSSCGGDCNDDDANIYPGATEVCNLIDDNCDGVIDENFDVDGDGVTSCGGDCDDLDNNNFPGNTEICDLQDNNCDAFIDEGFDLDGDGYSVCDASGVDCDDDNATIFPDAPELCDGLDNDCDGSTDEGVDDDNDGDGQSACEFDCDDSDPLNYFGNTEVCDNQDNNCDASIDEGFDLDGDGVSICSLPAVDCDDSDPLNFPGNLEICDLSDNNCDAAVDEGFDLDGDGFSVCADPVVDCDDSEAASFPGNAEICDGIDNNCDGAIDEGFDLDGDGVSVCASPVADCDDSNANVYPGHPEVLLNRFDDDCDPATSDFRADVFIIVPDDAGRIYYARSNGDGSWSNYRQIASLSGAIRGAAIADYDNDGDLDFVAGSPSGHTLSFHLFVNDGADNFSDAGVVGIGNNTNSYQMDMTAGDFDHDGNMDFRSNSNWTYMHEGKGDGNGNFTVTTIDLGIGNGRGLDTEDFDHDGHLDLVRATWSSGQVILYRGDGSGNFTNAGVVGDPGTDPYGVTAADFNNDGHADVLAIAGSNGNPYFYAGNGDGTFAPGVYVASADVANHGAYDNYDFNRDGNQDLVATSYTSLAFYYFPGNGDGTFGAAVRINPTNTLGNILGISAPPGPSPFGAPVPWITPNPYTGIKGDTVDLSGQFSTDDGNIVDYSWDFGDGDTDVGVNVSHTFPDVEDDFHVTLRVTDDEGKVGNGNSGLVLLVGDPPLADAGGPYSFGEDFAVAGVYTVPLDGSNSSDDGVDPLNFDWNLGDEFSEDFSAGALDPVTWDAANASVSAGEAVVTGAGWGNSYVVTRRIFPRYSDAVATFTGRVGTVTNPTVMWGLKNTNSNFSYTEFPYAIYFNNNSWIYIYEDGSSRGNVVQYTEGADYEVRIDLKPASGASYYIRPVGSSNWTPIYDSSYSSVALLRLGATVNGGAIRLDDFGKPGAGSSEEQPTATYFGLDLYNISLTVADIAEQSDSDTTTLETVAGDPPVSGPGGPYTPGEANASCGNYTVNFDGSGSSDDSGRIYRYDWDFGDGAMGSGVSPSHTYAAGGPLPNTYSATLTVTDHALQQNTLTTTATVTPTPGDFPVARSDDYNVDESAANAGLWTVNFNAGNSSDDVGLCDFAWTFGDGATGSGATPTHQYAAAGTYNGTLTVRDHALQSHQVNFTVVVEANDPPVPDDGGPYVIDESAAQNGLWTLTFDAGASDDDFGIWQYAWDFGDGGTGSGATPTHAYAADGTYTVTLTVTDNGRQTATSTTQVTVNSNDPPVANAGPDLITERGLPVTLDASGSTDDFGILSYSWDLDATPFSEDFAGGAVDMTRWAASGAVIDAGEAVVTGAGSWGGRYLVTQDTFTRVDGDSYTGRILAEAGGIRHVMWGLKNTNTDYNYTQFYYAIYFINNSIQIYENGSYRGVFGSWVDNTSYDVRIDVKAAGATYYYRETGAVDWIQIYDSVFSTGSPFRFGATIHSGVIHLDDFIGVIPNESGNNLSIVTATYRTVGTYQPAVTVTDHALQTDTDSATVTVLEGDPPVADAGGPYLTNEDIPTRFNGRGSTDDFAIKTYAWDFGDGESLVSANPWVDHRYLAEGSYTATLTVTDYAGHSASDSVTVTVSPVPVVVAVPWAFSGGIEVPHDTLSGVQTTLKAVAYSLREPLTYSWDFGDGSPPVSGAVTNKRVIQADHVYNGVEGQPFVATLTLTDTDGRQASDQYLLRIRASSLDIEINMAIDEGLWWLHANQNLGEFSAGSYGAARISHGYWDNTGGYGTTGWVASPTASAVQAFEVNAHLELGDVRENPYVDTVARGLRELPTHMRPINIGMQTYGDPDTNRNGIAVETFGGDNRPPYEVGQVMDALVASGSRSTHAITGPDSVKGRSYYDLVVDMVDAYAWGQHDGATVGGGWRYGWHSHPDNSAAQWGPIGMLAAEDVWGIHIPQWVKDRNDVWMSYSYNGVGFGYTGAGNGRNTTPSGMVQLAFDDKVGVNDPATTEDDRDPRWATAEDYIAAQWNNSFWLITPTRYSYYAYYAFTKAMRSAFPTAVTNLHATGLDWFKDDTNGIARRLIDRQQGDGGWPRDSDPGGTYVGYDLTTAWSVIMLTPTLFTQPPVADAGEDRVWGVGIALTLDGSRSYHLDPFRSIVKYEWDTDGDGTYDTDSSDPTTSFTYTAANCPGGVLPCNITVRLRVTDDNAPSQTDTDTATIIIAIPPHPPVADANGPYSCTAGIPCTLDGSGSFDIDPTDFITAWEWDLDNDGQFDNASGVQPTVVFANPGLFNIGLRVLDNAVLNDIDGDGVQDADERLDDFDFTTVTVLANNPPLANPGGPYSVAEGSGVTLDASASSDPDGNPITLEWDLDNDGLFDDATGSSATFDAAALDDGNYTVGLKVSDSLLDDTITTIITVNNVAPVVDAGPDQAVNEGDTVIFAGNFSDPGVLDTHTIEWDFGDGNTASGSLTPDHVYPDDGIYTVTLTVTDDDGGVGSDTLTVTVGDLAPAAAVTGDTTLIEGDTGSFDASASISAPDAIIGYEWDFDYDGTFDPSAETGVTATSLFPEDGLFSVAVRVTDEDFSTSIATIAVTVANAPPLVEAGADQNNILLGTPIALDPATFTDLGVFDTHTANIDWGDGTVEPGTVTQGAGSGTVDGTHGYTATGSYVVTVTVTDDDGGVGSDSFAVDIVATPTTVPTVDAGPDATIDEGDSFVSAGSFTDPDSSNWTATVDYGEGAGPQTLVLNPDGTFALSNSYEDDGVYTVTVTVTDDDGGVGSDTALVTVNNLPPVVEAGADQNNALLGTPIALDPATFTDLGVFDTHTANIDWGDGTVEPGTVTQGAGSGSVDGTHGYTATGSYVVTVTVTDDDGGVGTDSLQVTVQDTVAPSPIDDLFARAKPGKINLVWTPLSAATGYNVYRSTAPGGPYELIAASHQCDYCAYADFGLSNGTTYYYVVTWLDGATESLFSNEASATPSARRTR